jgi:hypothetical protein
MGNYSQLFEAEAQKKPKEQTPHSPLIETRTERPLPEPVPEDKASLASSGFVNKSTSQQANKETNPQISKSTSQQADKSTSQQTNKRLKRFGTYLTPESIRAMKQLALDTDKDDYEVFQEAVDTYLKMKAS